MTRVLEAGGGDGKGGGRGSYKYEVDQGERALVKKRHAGLQDVIHTQKKYRNTSVMGILLHVVHGLGLIKHETYGTHAKHQVWSSQTLETSIRVPSGLRIPLKLR